MEDKKKIIIVSGVNLYKAGSLKIMQQSLIALSDYAKEDYRIIALVHKKELYEERGNIEFMEFPKSRTSWLHRLYYEYFHFKKISQDYRPYCWLSMHDMTPTVVAPVRAVYCHNTSAFYKSSWKDLFFDYHFFLFSYFYNLLYRINIKKNNYVIVQQEWLRKEFERMYKINNVIVALPEVNLNKTINTVDKKPALDSNKKTFSFFYPSIPRVYKNFELICQATKKLLDRNIDNFDVYLTFDGSENKYAKELAEKYKGIGNLHFIGYQSQAGMEQQYNQCDCLLFPSKLESWGLPIMEAKERNIPILLADLPYAKETVGSYEQVAYFDPDNTDELASLMEKFIQGVTPHTKGRHIEYRQPYTNTWNGLFDILLKQD